MGGGLFLVIGFGFAFLDWKILIVTMHGVYVYGTGIYIEDVVCIKYGVRSYSTPGLWGMGLIRYGFREYVVHT